jgi:acetylglutamate kinase
MAWVQKDTVTKVREALKALNKEYGMKTSVSGSNSSSLNVRIISGKIDSELYRYCRCC